MYYLSIVTGMMVEMGCTGECVVVEPSWCVGHETRVSNRWSGCHESDTAVCKGDPAYPAEAKI